MPRKVAEADPFSTLCTPDLEAMLQRMDEIEVGPCSGFGQKLRWGLDVPRS